MPTTMPINADTLTTSRLSLSPVSEADAVEIQREAAAQQIADNMISLPHPYPPGEALRYVARAQAELERGHAVAFAIRNRTSSKFLGVIELRAIEREHSQGELSFWLAKSAWHNAYMPEALTAVVRYGFENLKLNRLYAYHMLRNPASGRILKKAGFIREGLLRQRVRKWEIFEDVALWAILLRDWSKSTQ